MPRVTPGASYADVRIGRYRSQSIATRERQVSGVSDQESYGLGVRTSSTDAGDSPPRAR